MRKAPILLAAIFSALVVLTVYGGHQRASAERVSSDPVGRAVARAGDVVARGGGVVTRERRDHAREATLEVKGRRGTRFSGTCTVGRKEREIGGQVPERFVYKPDGRRLECEIRKQSAGAMIIVLDAGNTDYVQQTGSRRATVRIVYSKGGFSPSISSSSTSQTLASNSSSVITSSMSFR